MAQEVQVVRPDAVIRGHDSYLRVFYDKLGLQFRTLQSVDCLRCTDSIRRLRFELRGEPS